jgi:hypothetical protein
MGTPRTNAKSRKPTRPSRSHRVARRQPEPQRASNTAIVVRPTDKPWLPSDEEKVLIKNQMCPGATDQEFALCLAEAKHRRLDPLKKQIWFVPRWNSEAENPDGSRGRKVWVAQTSIDGLRHIAARDHRDYGTEDEPEYGPLFEVKWSIYDKKTRSSRPGKPFMAPEWASVSVWKKGQSRPTVAKVWWDEIYADVSRSPLVREKPRLMLGKCAASQAMRKAYPETGGMYIPEEFAGKRPEFTPEGRKIEYLDVEPVEPQPEAENKFLSAYEQREQEQLKKLTPEQREVVERKMQQAKVSSDSGPAKAVNEGTAKQKAGVPMEATQKPRETTPAKNVLFILEWPNAMDGDVRVTAAAETIALLELKRKPKEGKAGEENHHLVKWDALPQFYDLCRAKGVEVRDLAEKA